MRAVKIDKAGFFVEDIPGDPEFTGAADTAPALTAPHSFMRPRYVEGAWTEGEDPATVAEHRKAAKASEERAWRDAELERTDTEFRRALGKYVKTGDMAEAAAVEDYAQALRDMPAQDPDPFKWIKPERAK